MAISIDPYMERDPVRYEFEREMRRREAMIRKHYEQKLSMQANFGNFQAVDAPATPKQPEINKTLLLLEI